MKEASERLWVILMCPECWAEKQPWEPRACRDRDGNLSIFLSKGGNRREVVCSSLELGDYGLLVLSVRETSSVGERLNKTSPS